MKRIYTILAAVIIVTANVFAQSPEKMSYQAVIRDASGTLIATQVGMKLSVLKGDDATSASEEYSETLTPTPNTNGLVSIEFGGQTGWDAIDWSDGKFFIKTETDVDNDGTYDVEGISQLLSVPYALHAKTAESITGDINETYTVGDTAFGGIIFYVNDAGTHGLVAAKTDQAYDGSDPETMVYYYDALRLCSDPSRFDEAGKEFTDWRLPTIAEAEILGNAFNNQGMIDKLGIPWKSDDYIDLYWFADVLYLDKLVDNNLGAGQSTTQPGYEYSKSSDKNLVRRGFGKLNNGGEANPYYDEMEYKTNVRCVRSF